MKLNTRVTDLAIYDVKGAPGMSHQLHLAILEFPGSEACASR